MKNIFAIIVIYAFLSSCYSLKRGTAQLISKIYIKKTGYVKCDNFRIIQGEIPFFGKYEYEILNINEKDSVTYTKYFQFGKNDTSPYFYKRVSKWKGENGNVIKKEVQKDKIRVDYNKLFDKRNKFYRKTIYNYMGEKTIVKDKFEGVD